MSCRHIATLGCVSTIKIMTRPPEEVWKFGDTRDHDFGCVCVSGLRVVLAFIGLTLLVIVCSREVLDA